jgi:peptide/nickel transport system ATP-binding protein
MEKGVFVESGDARRIIGNPENAYTKRLLSDVPKLHEEWVF